MEQDRRKYLIIGSLAALFMAGLLLLVMYYPVSISMARHAAEPAARSLDGFIRCMACGDYPGAIDCWAPDAFPGATLEEKIAMVLDQGIAWWGDYDRLRVKSLYMYHQLGVFPLWRRFLQVDGAIILTSGEEYPFHGVFVRHRGRWVIYSLAFDL